MTKQVDQVVASIDMEVTVQEAKTHLSRLLRRVEAGEEVLIRRGKDPVALLVPAPKKGKRNIWGNLDGEMRRDFDDPIEDFEPYM